MPELNLAGGRAVDWRTELGNKLLQMQKSDGSWASENGRWRESDPVYATALAILSLEHIHHSL
jgi:hypothetical protein